MASSMLGVIFGIPPYIWYPLIVILLIVLLVFYVRYRRQMSQ